MAEEAEGNDYALDNVKITALQQGLFDIQPDNDAEVPTCYILYFIKKQMRRLWLDFLDHLEKTVKVVCFGADKSFIVKIHISIFLAGKQLVA